MRLRPVTDFTRGLKHFVWVNPEDVVVKKPKPTRKVGVAKNQKGAHRRKSYEVDL